MSRNRFKIGIYGVCMNARIGLLPQEKRVTQEYRLTIEVEIPAAPLEHHPEDLTNSISYVDLYETAESEFRAGGDLLETMAVKISSKLLQEHPMIQRGVIEIVKLNPPICGMNGEAGIKYFFEKN